MALEVNVGKSTQEMEQQFIDEFMDAYQNDDMATFAENWGMTVEEAMEAAKQYYPLEEMMGSETDTGIDVQSILSGPVTQDQIDALMAKSDKAENMLPIGRVKKVADGMFRRSHTPSSKKAVTNYNKKKQKDWQKEASKSQAKKKDKELLKDQEDAAKIALGGSTIATAIGLSGDRDEDGSLKVAALPKEEPKKEKVDLNKIAREDRSVGEENPWEGNQLGYHKRPGQNFWTVDDTDPYWDTHEMGTGSPWEEAEPKQVVQEFDFSKWFK